VSGKAGEIKIKLRIGILSAEEKPCLPLKENRAFAA
jgi:hypothetical protein